MSNPKYIKLSWDEYQSLWDFIFNCCEVHKHNGEYIKWEIANINSLVKFCNEVDASIEAGKAAQERLIF